MIYDKHGHLLTPLTPLWSLTFGKAINPYLPIISYKRSSHSSGCLYSLVLTAGQFFLGYAAYF
jgi:hypothetical protein